MLGFLCGNHRLNMMLDLQSYLGSMCYCIHSLRPGNPPPLHPPAFGLIYRGVIGQPRKTTSLCGPRVGMHTLHSYIDELSSTLHRSLKSLLTRSRVENRTLQLHLQQSDAVQLSAPSPYLNYILLPPV